MSGSLNDAAEFWAEHYGQSDQIWSGEPNRSLVTAVNDLDPGKALDLGCGEGGDSAWLAAQGWQVTAVDISPTAISRAQAMVHSRGIPKEQTTWLVADLSTWQPAARYDLVSACFLHSPVDFPRVEVLRRAAGSVAVGGHLLIVGHGEAPPTSYEHDHVEHHFLSPAEELESFALDSADWEIAICETSQREGTRPDGESATWRDSVLLMRRK